MNNAGNINQQVSELLLGASAKSLTAPKEFDLMEMPLEGVAAFWLSVKKTMDSKKKGDEFLLEEAKHTREPHVRFLLELAASSFSAKRCEELAQVRKKTSWPNCTVNTCSWPSVFWASCLKRIRRK